MEKHTSIYYYFFEGEKEPFITSRYLGEPKDKVKLFNKTYIIKDYAKEEKHNGIR